MKPKKIKILYTIPNFDTAGSGKVVYDLVKHLDDDRFEPHICCMHTKGNFFKEVEKLELPIHLFQFTASYRPFLSFPYRLLKIVKFLKKHKFDVIHSWHWSSDFSEPLAARIARVPYVYTKKNMGWGNKAWNWKSKLSSNIVTINSDMESMFFSDYKKKVCYIPIGVDLGYYHSQKKVYITPEGLKFDEKDFIVATISNLLPIKGIEVLIRAIIELNDERIKLCILGKDDGDYARILKEMATKNSNIHFLGAKADVRPYHALLDLFVIPSLELGEGLGVAALEVMASSRIVIGSNVSGIKDVLKPFKDNLFEPNNIGSLKRRILYIMKLEKNEKNKLEKEMRNYVEKIFSKEEFVSKHEELYKEILE